MTTTTHAGASALIDAPTPTQQAIAADLGVIAPDDFDAATVTEQRIAFVADYLRSSGTRGIVLGISGGVDSTTAGRICQLSCERTGRTFIAVRLPYGVQADEAEAQAALEFIAPHRVATVDIKPATDALMASADLPGLALNPLSEGAVDFAKGNVKARQRMVVQYAIAGTNGMLVAGTDQAAEAVMGFYTLHGDGAADLLPIGGLTKRQVRAVAAHLGAPEHLVRKTPTADLEDLRPGLPDEAAHGVTYDQIDDYLEGLPVHAQAAAIIESTYRATAHKRAMPVAP